MNPIQEHMLKMFIALRWGVGLIGIALPLVLGCVGYWVYGIPLSGSMSAYYHATETCGGKFAQEALKDKDPTHATPPACQLRGTGPLRNWFVGSLCFIGAAMLLMRGFSILEDWLLNLAGVMAPCVALFPMNWVGQHGWTPHLYFAISFFVFAGLTCLFCSGKTLSQMPGSGEEREKKIAFYRRWYWTCGVLMIGAPLSAFIFLTGMPTQMFVVESAGVWAFGFYWLFKTFELKDNDVEAKALKGELNVNRRALGWEETQTPETVMS